MKWGKKKDNVVNFLYFHTESAFIRMLLLYYAVSNEKNHFGTVKSTKNFKSFVLNFYAFQN